MAGSNEYLADISTETKLELTICSKIFFDSEWDPEHLDTDQHFIEGITWSLARDADIQVRQKLALQLAECEVLPLDLAGEIASDIPSVSAPFIAKTKALTDKQLADLIPFLKEKVISILAKRGDIEDQTIYAISVHCDANGAEELARNTIIFIDEKTARKLISRFDDNIAVMNMLVKRLDLTREVLDEILKILSALRRGSAKVGKIASSHMEGVKVNVRGADIICEQLENSSPQQIHSIAIDFRQKQVVNYIEVMEITERTNINFLVSILALEAGQTLGSVRDALSLKDTGAFINLLKAAGVDMKYGPRLMDIVKRYSHSLDE